MEGERERINRSVIDVMMKREVFGRTDQLLLMINDITDLVLNEATTSFENGGVAASDATNEAWVDAVRRAASEIGSANSDMIISSVIGE